MKAGFFIGLAIGAAAGVIVSNPYTMKMFSKCKDKVDDEIKTHTQDPHVQAPQP